MTTETAHERREGHEKSGRVSLDDMLRARDRRSAHQEQFLKETHLPLLSMTLNMPGDVKRTRLSALFFAREKNRLIEALTALGGVIVREADTSEKTGDEALFAVDGLRPAALKELAMSLESRGEASRLLDLDVFDAAGTPVSRSALGAPPRRCLLCDQPAPVCARSRAHPLPLLRREIDRRLTAAVADDAALRMASHATEASSFELMVSGKPGLVTMTDSGSHDDMDRFTFARAQAVFPDYYKRAFLAGFFASGTRASADRAESFLSTQDAAALRLEGILAERRMLDATGGVNTHRGWIYTSGVLLAAAGFLFRFVTEGEVPEESNRLHKSLQERMAGVARSLESVLTSSSMFENLAGSHPSSSCAVGVRREALSGFPSIMETGLKVMASRRDGVSQREDDDALGRRVFLALLGVVEDTTLQKRGGPSSLRTLRAYLRREWLRDAPFTTDSWREAMIKADDEDVASCLAVLASAFQKDRLTAGGAADALAGTRLVYACLSDITDVLRFLRSTL